MKIVKIVVLLLYVAIQVILCPIWMLWVMHYSWRRDVFSHMRIQMMQNTATFADWIKLCKFYHLIRIIYKIGSMIRESKGEYIYLGNKTLCIKYSSVADSLDNKPTTREEFLNVVDTAIWASKRVVNLNELNKYKEGNKKKVYSESDGKDLEDRTSDKNDKKAVYVVIHGGGFIYGSPDTVADFSSTLNKMTHDDVIVIKYPLAPEHPYPRALIEIGKVLVDLNELYDEIHVIGVSAGANLALAASIFIRDSQITKVPTSLTLLAGTYSLYTDTASYNKFSNGPKLTKSMMCQYLSLYLKGDMSLVNCLTKSPVIIPLEKTSRTKSFEDLIYTNPLTSPYALPLNCNDYTSLPKALLIAAENDILYNDTQTLNMRIRNDGGLVEMIVIGGPHVHLAGEDSEINKRLIQYITKFINHK